MIKRESSTTLCSGAPEAALEYSKHTLSLLDSAMMLNGLDGIVNPSINQGCFDE